MIRPFLLTTLFGIALTPVCHAGPQDSHRLQMRFEVDAASPALLQTLKKRAESYAAFRGLGPAIVRKAAAKGGVILVEFPLRQGEKTNTDALQGELKELFTRVGGVDFTWDRGTASLEALQQLKKHIGDGQIDTKGAPRLKIDNTMRSAEIDQAIAKAPPTSGIRWVVETAMGAVRKTGPLYNIYAAAPDAFLTDSAIASAVKSNAMIGPQGIIITFTPEAAKIFAQETGNHVGQRLLILFEGRVDSAPTVREASLGGQVRLGLDYMFSRGPGPGEVERLIAIMSAGRLDTEVRLLDSKVLAPEKR